MMQRSEKKTKQNKGKNIVARSTATQKKKKSAANAKKQPKKTAERVVHVEAE